MSAVALHARWTSGFEQRVQEAAALLKRAATEHAGHIVQATSFGVEDMVITDLLVAERLDMPVATLDTGLLHPETLALRTALAVHYRIVVETHAPQQDAVMAFVRRHGPRAMYESVPLRQACCTVRKREPLARLLAGRTAWVTGLRREQSPGRAEVAARELDSDGRTKLNPLADWSLADVWHYVERHGVPYNQLHDRHFPSIGCAPCTRPVAAGEDVRAGRWWWEEEGAKECGLHVDGARVTAAASQGVTA